MTTPKDTIWEIEPHTQAKHEILQRYLGAWFAILSSYNQRVIYIDGFCGPGRYKGGEPGSPLIALEEAKKHKDRLENKKISFLFMDERLDRVQHLINELDQLAIPSIFNVKVISGDFETQFRKLLDLIDSRGLRLAPTFAFIDPFGFKGLPFELVERLLKHDKTEVLINVMVDSINRFLDHPTPKTKQHIVDMFGTKQALDIAHLSNNRISDLRLLYQNQLLKCAKFVRYFEMRDTSNRPIYYLFFASNHPLGHVKMKEAFWKADPSSGYQFSDATDPMQMVLFEYDESPKLAQELQNKFNGQEVSIEKVRIYVEDETPFLKTHMRKALSILETNKSIEVRNEKLDGKKRIKNTFPDNAIVVFS